MRDRRKNDKTKRNAAVYYNITVKIFAAIRGDNTTHFCMLLYYYIKTATARIIIGRKKNFIKTLLNRTRGWGKMTTRAQPCVHILLPTIIIMRKRVPIRCGTKRSHSPRQ